MQTSEFNRIIKKAARLYNKGGVQSVIYFADALKLPYGSCLPCEAEMPYSSNGDVHLCLVCGSSVKITAHAEPAQGISK